MIRYEIVNFNVQLLAKVNFPAISFVYLHVMQLLSMLMS